MLCCGIIAFLLASLGFSVAGTPGVTAGDKLAARIGVRRKIAIAVPVVLIICLGLAIGLATATGGRSTNIVFRHLCLFPAQKVPASPDK